MSKSVLEMEANQTRAFIGMKKSCKLSYFKEFSIGCKNLNYLKNE